MLQLHLKLICFLVPVCLLLFSGCEEKEGTEVIFKEVPVKLDATCTWLEEKQHFHNEEYDRVFQDYYNEKLNQNDYVSAAKALEIVAENHSYYSSFDSSFQVTIQSFRQLYAGKLPRSKTTFLDNYMANYYSDQGDFREAITYYEPITRIKAEDFYTCTNIAYAYCDMAFCYSSVGDQEAALEANLKSLSFFNRTDDPSGKSTVYTNLFLVHLFTKNYGAAEIYIDKSIQGYRERNDTTNLFISMVNKNLLYEETGNPARYSLIDSTYRYFNACKLNDPSLKISIYTEYSKKLVHDGKAAEAGQILTALEPEVKELDSPFSDAEYIAAKAEYELAANKGILDVGLIERALAIVEENEHYQTQLSYYDVLKNDAILKKDYRKALSYSEKAKIATEHLATEKMMIKTAELDKQHQAEKRQQKIAIQGKAISNGKTTIALLISLIVGLLLVVIIVQSAQQQKKIKSESRRAQQYTWQLLQKTEEERKRIASDLHDSVSHELLNLKHSMGSETAGDKIDVIINDIRSISRNLHPVMFEKVGLAASIDQLTERAQAVNGLMVTADIAYDSSLSVSDELQVYRIIQEGLSNIIKYAEAVAAKITIHMDNDDFHIEIKDNGKGFNVNETLSGGDAFGLHNIIERSKAIGGTAKITSDKTGTIITISLKKIR